MSFKPTLSLNMLIKAFGLKRSFNGANYIKKGASFSIGKGFSHSLLRHSEGFSPKSFSFQWKERRVDFSLPNLIRFFALRSQNDRKSLLNLSTPQLLNLSYKHRLEGLACSP